MTYPLYRNLVLADKVWEQASECLKMGKRALLRLFLDAREICMDGDWSVFNRIMFEDLTIWSQTSKDRVLDILGQEMGKVEVDLKEIGFELELPD
jgi:hypothetical protein